MKKIFSLISILITFFTTTVAQELSLIAKTEKDKVILRWMPQSFDTWQKGNAVGYQLFRQTTHRNGLKIDEAQILLTPSPIVPLKENYWKLLSKQENFATVAYQFLTAPTPEDQTSKDLSFAMAMLMSNTSGAIAGGMAMLYEDRTTAPNEQYIYTVVIDKTSISASMSVETAKITRLLPPSNLYGEFQDSTLFIRWNVSDSLLHSAFVVERSDDGGLSYQATQAEPILALAEPDSLGNYIGTKSENLPQLYQAYFYRVKAITPFGILSEPSNVIRIYGYRTKLPLPKVKTFLPKNKEKGVRISWNFPDSLNNDIRGFDVLRAEKLGEKYEKLNPKPLSRQTRMYVDSLPLSEGYYQVSVINWAYKSLSSYPEFVQLEDSIPPQKPVWKTYQSDQNGIVTLRWKANHEKDFLGYSIYRGDNPKRELSLITSRIMADSVYQDTVSLNLLNKKIYYSIIAFDKRLNPSVHADTVIVLRPDIIPPASPNFTDFSLSDTSIAISWVNSPSQDLDSTFLYRVLKSDSLNGRALLLGFSAQTPLNNFLDTTAAEKTPYVYQLIAQDDAGLRSN
ncbi:MAG: fibronectin type III domain-containing protein, partial [Spirosomataceae bacterium]